MGHDLNLAKNKEVNRLLEIDLRLYFHRLSLPRRGEQPMTWCMKQRARDTDILIPLVSKREKVSREVQGMIKSLTRNKRE